MRRCSEERGRERFLRNYKVGGDFGRTCLGEFPQRLVNPKRFYSIGLKAHGFFRTKRRQGLLWKIHCTGKVFRDVFWHYNGPRCVCSANVQMCTFTLENVCTSSPEREKDS